MKTTYIEEVPEDIRPAIADLVHFKYDPAYPRDTYLITRINVPKKARGRGVANKLLERIIKDADDEGVCLIVEISPSDGLNYSQLFNWYYVHGFIRHVEGDLQIRRPNERVVT